MNEQDKKLLGTMPDMELAAQLGLSHTWVRKQRVALGIKPYAQSRERIDWEKWDAELLANKNVASTVLAKQIDCDPSTVRERRRFLLDKKGKYTPKLKKPKATGWGGARPGAGAPLKEDPLDCLVSARITTRQHSSLQDYADNLGLDVPAALRHLLDSLGHV